MIKRMQCKFQYIFLLFVISIAKVYPQYIQNPSLEGETGAVNPNGWFVCDITSSPDVHGPNGIYREGFDGLMTQSPNDGSTYVVLKTRGPTYIDYGETPPNSREHLSTKLLKDFEKDVCYEFKIFICFDSEIFMNSETDYNIAHPVKFQLWGGVDSCSRDELLIESSLITNSDWKEYSFKFTPDANYSYILMEPQWENPDNPYNGALIIDNLHLTSFGPQDAQVKNVYDLYYQGDVETTLLASLGESYDWNPKIGLDSYNNQRVTIISYNISTYSVLIQDMDYCYFIEEFNVKFSCDTITKNNIVVKLDTFVIENSTFQITASQSLNDNYFWFPSVGLSDASVQDPVVTIQDEGIQYSVELKDKYGCPNYEGFYINIVDCDAIISEKDILQLDTLIKSGENVLLKPSEGSKLSENWFPPDNLDCFDCLNPVANPVSSCQYKAVLKDKYGCLYNEYFNIGVEFFIPNAFSPNNDGINDVFKINGLPGSSTLRIFTREGKIVYESDNYMNDWDGKDKDGNQLQSNTYWYHLIYQGSEFKNIKIKTSDKIQSGFVFIKR